jgi:hypothetical protein
MSKRCIWVAVSVCAVLLLAPFVNLGVGHAQESMKQAPLYTYVASWGVPRAQWSEYAKGTKDDKAVFDKLMAEGTIVGWGEFENVVHDPSGYTHGDWWQATSFANILKALDALRANASQNAALNNAKHEDSLLRTVIHGGKHAAAGPGYVWVAMEDLKTGSEGQFIEMFEKEIQPLFEQLVADGTVTYYGLDVQAVHTDNPNSIDIVYILPSAEAVDKVQAAIFAAEQKNPLVGREFDTLTKGENHRDLFARIVASGSK